jgi:hypothetical protein
MRIVQDTNGWFGLGTTNRFLRIENGIGFGLFALNSISEAVVTMSFDFIDWRTTVTSPGEERLTVQFLAGDGSTASSNRAHVLSLRDGAEILQNAGTYTNNMRLRWDVVVNNSASVISYASPLGTKTLAPGSADVWVDRRLAAGDYAFERQASPGSVRSVTFQTFGTDRFSVDIDNFKVLAGAHVSTPPPSPAPPTVFLGPDGRLVYTRDVPGNQVPDFSNAGYMGGGVPIPDVPVKVILHPQASGDDTVRIQAAIDLLAAMPLDETGFRGAILLKRGQYRVADRLEILTGGIVLRGEGQEADGTVLIATRNGQRNLIRVGGGGTWREVANSRKTITDTYVPVGARSFHVSNTNNLKVGDSIMVHRPSTAEWISAIGMDQIPPRPDGNPIEQWEPGEFDLHFDRIITAIDGKRITIDAPLVNALEEQYGGGTIFRYNFPGRDGQVGIENLRGVSEHIGPEDEEHGWRMIILGAVQNMWVRQVTAVHFGYSAVQIGRMAKWVTIEDCSHLDPVSIIAGSRRYPFNVLGQLSLVQRCYARNGRHDFVTASLTHGPNVFLDSSADNSHSDTGPHHRWATGTLYDNIRVPAHDIAVQNRLSFGSGHGWAGANHVVWNSTANRIVVQNPPTAQNWCFGAIGTKWAGAFPDYASDGYWISHGTKMLPHSLYLKQLEERLDAGIGAVAIVDFGAASYDVEADRFLLPVVRRGNRDGQLHLRLAANYERLFTEDSLQNPGTIPAGAVAGELTLALHEHAYLPTNRIVTISLLPGAGYSAGSSNQVSFVLSARPVTFQSWLVEHFTAAERQDEAVSGIWASPAGDDMPNFAKYAFGIPPWTAIVAGDLPRPVFAGGRLSVTYDRPKGISDIEYFVEVSDDLENWSGSGDAVEVVEVADFGSFERITMAERTAGDVSRRFMRLKLVLAQ